MAIQALVEWTIEHPERKGLARWESCLGTITEAADLGGRAILIQEKDGRRFSAEEMKGIELRLCSTPTPAIKAMLAASGYTVV